MSWQTKILHKLVVLIDGLSVLLSNFARVIEKRTLPVPEQIAETDVVGPDEDGDAEEAGNRDSTNHDTVSSSDVSDYLPANNTTRQSQSESPQPVLAADLKRINTAADTSKESKQQGSPCGTISRVDVNHTETSTQNIFSASVDLHENNLYQEPRGEDDIDQHVMGYKPASSLPQSDTAGQLKVNDDLQFNDEQSMSVHAETATGSGSTQAWHAGWAADPSAANYYGNSDAMPQAATVYNQLADYALVEQGQLHAEYSDVNPVATEVAPMPVAGQAMHAHGETTDQDNFTGLWPSLMSETDSQLSGKDRQRAVEMEQRLRAAQHISVITHEQAGGLWNP